MSSEAAPADVAAVAPADRLADLKAARQALKRQLAQATREVKSQDIDWWPSHMVMSCLDFPSTTVIHSCRQLWPCGPTTTRTSSMSLYSRSGRRLVRGSFAVPRSVALKVGSRVNEDLLDQVGHLGSFHHLLIVPLNFFP